MFKELIELHRQVDVACSGKGVLVRGVVYW